MDIRQPSFPSLLFFCPPLPSLPQQSLNDKRKKNLFSRKFTFYKNKEASEPETSDVDRKYRKRLYSAMLGENRAAGHEDRGGHCSTGHSRHHSLL